MSQLLTTAFIRLPYPPYLWRVVRRGAGIWLLVRSAYVVVLMVGVGAFDLFPSAEGAALVVHPSGATRAALVTITAILVWWDRRRSHELLLSANLGAWEGWFWTASLLGALAMDMAVQSLLAAL